MKAPKRNTRKSRKKPTLIQRLLLVIMGAGLLAVFELLLRLLLPGSLAGPGEDPYVGFSGSNPLFVTYRAEDGSFRMKTAPGKLSWFNPQDFAARKQPGTFRIFTLGGSTTYGHPFLDATSFSGWLRRLLARIPGSGMNYEVVNCGGISYASYRMVRIMEELLNFEPDLFIIEAGHNEFLEARTYEKFFNRPSLLSGFQDRLSRLRTYQLLSRAYHSLRGKLSGGKPAGRAPESGTVLPSEVQTILDRSAGLDYYRRDTLFSNGVFEHFRFNIRRMKTLCAKAGVPAVFLRPVDNIKDFSPFKSQSREGLDDDSRMRFARSMSSGMALLAENRIAESIQSLRMAVSIDPKYADAHFSLGRALLAEGDTLLAGEELYQARELDVCPLRAQEPIHRILLEEATSPDAELVDVRTTFERRSPGGLIGNELLDDHIHPSSEGNLLIALQLMGWMEKKGFIQQRTAPSPAELGVLFKSVLDSLPPAYFREGTINLAKVLLWAKKFREVYHILVSQWNNISSEGEAQYLMGSTLLRLGAPGKAVEYLRNAETRTPDHLIVLTRLAEAYLLLDQVDSAKVTYEKALNYYPDNYAMLSNYAEMLGRLGRTDSALALYRRIKAVEPQLPGLDHNIGRLYVMKGQIDKAEEAFREAAGIEAESPQAFYNLGLLYAQLGRTADAEKCFQETLRRDPGQAGARIGLGRIYRDSGRLEQAEEEFRLALYLDPGRLENYIELALFYRSSGMPNQAGQIAGLGLQRFPDNPELTRLSRGEPPGK